MMSFTIFCTFWVFAPVVSAIAFIYFSLVSVYFRYLILFCHMPLYETGGLFFFRVAERVLFGLAASNAIFVFWLLHRHDFAVLPGERHSHASNVNDRRSVGRRCHSDIGHSCHLGVKRRNRLYLGHCRRIGAGRHIHFLRLLKRLQSNARTLEPLSRGMGRGATFRGRRLSRHVRAPRALILSPTVLLQRLLQLPSRLRGT